MDGLQVVCFAVGPYRCALDILGVREIIEPSAPAPLPQAAAGVEGVIELRGVFLPVVDLRKRLGVTAAAPAGKLVVAQLGPDPSARVALGVDQVFDVRRWGAGQVTPPPPLAAGDGPPCVRGVVKQGDEVVLLLELAQLVDPAALAAARR